MIIFHGSKEVVDNPEIRMTRYNKDFYHGFYCTLLEEQAIRWAVRVTGSGVLNEYEYIENPKLSIKHFTKMSDEWLDFIVSCRNGIGHNYDIVEGPMADDQIYNYIQSFLDGTISREAFWELAKFRKPTHQISFHTRAALHTIRFINGRTVYDER